LSVGNNAGTTGIDMNSQNITNANSIGCDIGSTNTSVLDTSSLTITDTSTSYSATLSSSQLTMNNPTYGTPIIIDATVPSIVVQENTTIITTIKAPDITLNYSSTTQSFIMPVTFTNELKDSYDYNTPNNWQMVKSNTMTIPTEIFTQPNGFYFWKIDFAINCWNMSVQSDKGYAMYVEFLDSASTSFYSQVFNNSTPYTTYKNASNYSNTVSQTENYVLTDYINFTGCSGSPLTINFYRYGDSGCTADFYWVLSLSRTNIV